MTEIRPAWRPSRFLLSSAALHLSAVAYLVLRPGDWPWVASALVLDHGGLAAGGLIPRASWLGPNLRRCEAGSLGPGEVALTFDDGPDPVVTPRVLDILDRARWSASFFCIGRSAQRHAEIVEEIARRGHKVENHTFGHSHAFAFYGPRTLGRDLDRAQEVLGALTGRRPEFFRAPAGIRSVLLDPALHRRGLRLVSWSRRGFDTVDRDPARVTRRLLRGVSPGDVLLLHDGSSCRDRRGEAVVLEVLERVVEALTTRGMRAVSLPSLS